MINLPNFLVVGAYSRNAGKTSFCKRVLASRQDIIAVKVTVIRGEGFSCPRGGSGCGVCGSLEGDYVITNETDRDNGKDTGELIKGGARQVLWLRIKEHALTEGMEELLKLINSNEPVICESNSVMRAINPSLFFIMKDADSENRKKTARAVESRADRIIETEKDRIDFDFSGLRFTEGKWTLSS